MLSALLLLLLVLPLTGQQAPGDPCPRRFAPRVVAKLTAGTGGRYPTGFL